jgi:hypothetical protein
MQRNEGGKGNTLHGTTRVRERFEHIAILNGSLMFYVFMYIKTSLLHRMKTAFVPPLKPTENIYTARLYIFCEKRGDEVEEEGEK